MRVLSFFILSVITFFVIGGDVYENLRDLVDSNGLQVVEHEVTTMDGYICTVHQLINPKSPATKGPILLQHGVADSADTWVMDKREKSLGYILVDEGYQVYLGNSRGNKYCKKHKTLSTSDHRFWEFTWDAMAKYDQPAFIDFILGATGSSSLVYIGHSQGTTQMFAALVSNPELSKKISLFIALAPVVYIGNTSSDLLKSAAKLEVDKIVTFFGVDEFVPSTKTMRWLMPKVCDSVLTRWICESAISVLAGYNPDELEKSQLSVITRHFPSGTSAENMAHWAQMLRGTRGQRTDFTYFNFGEKENLQKYGQKTPPTYDVRLFPMNEVKLVLFSGGYDGLATRPDVERLIRDLPSPPVADHYIKSYDHGSFVWGKNARRDVYEPILNYINIHQIKSVSSLNAKLTGEPVSRSFYLVLVLTCGITLFIALILSVFLVSKYRKQKRNNEDYLSVPSPNKNMNEFERDEDVKSYHSSPV
eukprot:c12167_g1_i1.p1 GENE.c12167_g1_i1~~c12167_g1_i1.p1  ORF type:complete len:476 (+),score=179.62 c12167_g1_i1:44-1471(+)